VEIGADFSRGIDHPKRIQDCHLWSSLAFVLKDIIERRTSVLLVRLF
jgi:hypothetical protein